MTRIVYLEDCTIIRESVAEVLRNQHFSVVTASSPEEARHAITMYKPELLLLELELQSGWCFDLLKQLVDDVALTSVHVMALTNVATREGVLQAREAGVMGYLLKERFTVDALVSMIRTTLARPNVVEAASQDAPHAGVDEVQSEPAETKTQPTHIKVNVSNEQALSEMRPLVTKTRMKEELEKLEEVKAMSPTVAVVLELTNRGNVDVESIVKAVRNDQAISLKLIRLANSSVYSRGDSVNTLKDAVMRIGITQVRQAVLNIGVMDSFDSDDQGGKLRIGYFWEHSISTGLIASMLAREHCDLDSDAAFTAGLIHDVGKLLLAGRLPEEYRHVLNVGHELGIPTERAESRLLGLNHAEIMDRVLRAWNFPPDLIDPIVFHELSIGNVRQVAPKRMRDVAVIGLANRLAHAMLLGSSGNDVVYPTTEHCQALKVPDALLERIQEHVPAEADDVRLTMMTKGNDAKWTPFIMTVQERLPAPLRLLTVSMHTTSDAVQIFCKRLSAPITSEETPLIGVVHIADKREVEALSKQIQSFAQQGSLHDDSPLIIISPSGDCELDSGVMQMHDTALLKIPYTIDSFLRCCESTGNIESEHSETKTAA